MQILYFVEFFWKSPISTNTYEWLQFSMKIYGSLHDWKRQK